jgi:hypothetical protein
LKSYEKWQFINWHKHLDFRVEVLYSMFIDQQALWPTKQKLL